MKEHRFQLSIHHVIIFVLLLNVSNAFSQEFMMQGWYWDYPKTANGYTWADTMSQKAAEIGQAGFTYMWLPPLSKASFGSGSNGYDPRDLYDYGDYGATGYGTRSQLDLSVNALGANGVKVVADVVFNHRDGGSWENNAGLESYVDNYNWSMVDGGANPFPYDRMRNIIPIGGTTGLGVGTYYFKVSSASGHSKYNGWEYKISIQTNSECNNWETVNEVEPNGGGDCGQGNQSISLCTDYLCHLDDVSGCAVDEFALTLNAEDFDSDGDTLYIYWGNRTSGYSDARIYSIWYDGAGGNDVVDNMRFQTMTDFSGMPSGRGGMHWNAFKPNLDRGTYLEGDWDGMYFFYDYDQFQQVTKDTLYEWAKWNWNDVGVRGFRMDAVKHFTPEFVGDLFDYLHDNDIDPGLAVGEWYSTGTGELAGWVNSVYSYMDEDTKGSIAPKIFDFALRESLRQACDGYGYDVRNVFGASLHDAEGLNGNNVVTFVNNHDFRDESDFASLIQNDPMLAYAYILTNNHLGLPSVFYPDYYGYPDNGTSYYPDDKSAHKNDIDELMQAHKNYIHGSSAITYLNKEGSGYINDHNDNSYVLVYQLNGTDNGAGPDVVVAINFGGVQVQFHQQVRDLAVGTNLTDIFGHSANPAATVQTEENGIPNDIWIDLPARSYAVWVEETADVYVPGDHNDWNLDNDNKSWLKDIGGDTKYYGHTLQATVDNGFKIVNGNTWEYQWGNGYWINNYNIMWNIEPGGIESSNAYWKEFTGTTYIHMCIEDPAKNHGTNLPVGIMRLSEPPATILKVDPVIAHSAPEGSSASVGITLSDDAAPEEKVFIRYTDDFWVTDYLVQANGSGTEFTALLPSAPAGTERVYYALTSTAEPGDVSSDPDLFTIHYDINDGRNYQYYVPETTSDACLSFNGNGSHVSVSSFTDDEAPNMTIEAWVHAETSPESFMPVIARQLYLNGPQDYLQFAIGISNDNKVQFIYDDENGIRNTVQTNPGAIRRDAWNHIATRITHNAGSIDVSIFVNGFEETTVSGLNYLYGGQENHEIYIGAAFLSSNHFFKGSVDELKVWKEARTNTAIQSDMSSYPEGSEQNLIFYFAFEEGSGTMTKDLSHNTMNGLLEEYNESGLPQWTAARLPAVWTGASSSAWDDINNWGWYGRLPNDNDDVIITSWAPNDPLMTGELDVEELILYDRTPFRVSPGSSIRIHNGIYYKNELRIQTNTTMVIRSGIGI